MEICKKPNCANIVHCHEIVHLHNATSRWHIDVHKQNGLVTAKEYKIRSDAGENIDKIYGLD